MANDREHELRIKLQPNKGAQRDFILSEALYPALIGGQGSGKTWGGAAWLVQQHVRWPGTDSLAIEPTYSNLLQIMIPALDSMLNTCRIKHTIKLTPPIEIHTPELGSRFLLHSAAAAETITGFEVGRAWIDEPARMPETADPKRFVWLAAVGRVRSPNVPVAEHRIAATGTHEGQATWFHRKWERNPKPGFTVYRASTGDNPSSRDQVQQYMDEYGPDLAQQYIYGYAVENSMAAVSWETILACQDAGCLKSDLAMLASVSGPLYVGMDIGRSASLTVFWIVRPEGDKLVTQGVIEMRQASFAEQTQAIKTVVGLPGFARLAIDATYNPQTAEDAMTLYGESRIEPVVFTAATKLEIMQGWIKACQGQRLRIPVDEDIAADFYSVKRVVSANGAVQYHAPFTADGHADRAIAAALAVRAAGQPVGKIEYMAGPKWAASSMRGL